MISEKLVNDMNTGKMAAITETYLAPLLIDERDRVVAEMCASFREGKSDFVAQVAQLAFMQDLLNKFTAQKRTGESAFKKLEQNQKTKE